MDACTSSRTFFAVLIPPVGDSGANDSTYVEGRDYPAYNGATSTSYYKDWWLCERCMLKQLTLELELE